MPAFAWLAAAASPEQREQQGRTDKRCNDTRGFDSRVREHPFGNALAPAFEHAPLLMRETHANARTGRFAHHGAYDLCRPAGQTLPSRPAPPSSGLALVRDPRCPGPPPPSRVATRRASETRHFRSTIGSAQSQNEMKNLARDSRTSPMGPALKSDMTILLDDSHYRVGASTGDRAGFSSSWCAEGGRAAPVIATGLVKPPISTRISATGAPRFSSAGWLT